MNRKQRMKNRANAEALRRPVWRPCPNCGELTENGHFAPPCFGQPGSWLCQLMSEKPQTVKET